MNGLAAALIGFAALFADRAVRGSRRSDVVSAVRPLSEPSRRLAMPRWVPVAAGGACGLLAGPVGAVLGAGGVMLAMVVRSRSRRRRVADLRDEQLADAVRSIAAAARAGRSIPQALAYAAEEASPPIADDLAALVNDIDSGTPLDRAFDGWAGRIAGSDAELAVAALRLHRRTGGDLPLVLDGVADTLRARRAVDREVRAMTAQARLSGTILGVLPVGFFAILWLTSSGDLTAAFTSPVGRLAVAVGLGMDGAAYLWIRRLLDVA